MNSTLKYAPLTICAALAITGSAGAQQTTTRTNQRGDTVGDTRSVQSGEYTNDRTVITPNGKVHTSSYTASRNASGGLVTTDTHTGPNGRSATSTTTHGWRGNKTTVTGPNGRSHTYYRSRR